MFKSILNFRRNPNREIVDALYEQIVASARQPVFYSHWGVPDTPLGRFEMLSVHIFLFLERVRAVVAVSGVAQDLTDEFFKDVEHSLRELGIGDMGVPKRMKKLARMFYGRAEAYGAALRAEDRAAMAEALSRNVLPDESAWAGAAPLATYMFDASAHLAAQSDADIAAGRISFPAAAAQEPSA